MNDSIVSEIERLRQLIEWLHEDLDDSLIDAEIEVIENYSLMFHVLSEKLRHLSLL